MTVHSLQTPALVSESLNLNSLKFNSKNGWKLYHLNICSLYSKIDEIRCISSIIQGQVSLLGFSETHLCGKIDNREINIPGYQLFRNDRDSRSGGGVAVYVFESIRCLQRTDLLSVEIESLWIEIIHTNNSPILIGVVYRPPNSSNDWFNQFEAQIDKASTIAQNIIMMGEFNIDFQKEIPHRWQQLYQSYSFIQLINEPTRITSTTSTTIDHIYVTNQQYVRDVAIFKISLSNHFAVGLCWKNGNLGRCVSEDHLCIRYKKVNNEQIKMKLNNLHLNMISVLQSDSVNDKLSQFNYILSSSSMIVPKLL